MSIDAGEKRKLERLSKAAGLSMSRYLLQEGLSGPKRNVAAEPLAEITHEIGVIRRQLVGVSNNLNQLAKHANAHDTFPEEAKATRLIIVRMMGRIDESLRVVRSLQ